MKLRQAEIYIDFKNIIKIYSVDAIENNTSRKLFFKSNITTDSTVEAQNVDLLLQR